MTTLRARERATYEEMWAIDAYAQNSPGVQAVPLFLDMTQTHMRTSVLDAGCGTGKGAVALQAAGFLVQMCDLTDAGLVPEARSLPFTEACLWEDLTRRVGFQDWVYCCFPAGTIIGGSTTPIEQLTVGQGVGDAAGREQSVVRTYRHEFTGDMVRLSVDCVPDVSMTPEHPVLISTLRRVHVRKSMYELEVSVDSWKQAASVVAGDWVSIPRLTGSAPFQIGFERGRSHARMTVDVDEGLAWLLGMYVAEGSTSYGKGIEKGKGRLTFSLGFDERDFADRIIRELNRIGVHGFISASKSARENGSLRVIASSIGLCRLFDAWCGKFAENKTVPEGIKRAPAKVIRAFILGLVDGDGCIRRDKRNNGEYYSVVTVSRRLAHGLLELLYKIGVHARLSNPQPSSTFIMGRTVSTLPAYTVAWQSRSWDGGRILDSAGRSPYGRARFVNGRVYLQVRGVAREPIHCLPVFNIETVDHTYGVPYTVHNCDVLEHVPTAFTMLVVSRLLAVARRGVFLTISTQPDACGVWVGKPLHQTVESFVWWRDQLRTMGQLTDARDLLTAGAYLVRAPC